MAFPVCEVRRNAEQNDNGPARDEKIADRANHRRQNVIDHLILEIARV